MSTIINTNVMALNAHRNLGNVSSNQEKSSQRLSSGLRINSAADDAAGLAISEKMRSQIRGLDMANKNAQDGVSLIQNAEGGMQEVGNMLQRMRELVVQAANDTNERTATTGDTQKIQDEINQLVDEIDKMSDRVSFNNKQLINGKGIPKEFKFQVGANEAQLMTVSIPGVDTKALNIKGAGTGAPGQGTNVIDVSTNAATADTISALTTTIDGAISNVNSQRASLGAVQNRLEYTMKSLQISSENMSAAESRIRDTDMAKEMMNFTKTNVLQQAATSMLAQANQAPQSVLKLLG